MDTRSYLKKHRLAPWKYKLCLYKSYWETGYGLTHYIKYPLAISGMAEWFKWKEVIWLGIIYFFLCFFIGYLWFTTHLKDAAAEVGNQYNPFIKDMRKEKLK